MKEIELTLTKIILFLTYLAEDKNSVIRKEQASVNIYLQSFLSKISFILDKQLHFKGF